MWRNDNPFIIAPSFTAIRQLSPKENPRYCSFFNSVILTPLLRPQIKAFRQLRPLMLVPNEDKSLYYGQKPFSVTKIIFDKVVKLICHDA